MAIQVLPETQLVVTRQNFIVCTYASQLIEEIQQKSVWMPGCAPKFASNLGARDDGAILGEF